MASNMKRLRIRLKCRDNCKSSGLELATCSGQLSYFCPKCGAYWCVTHGAEHACPPPKKKNWFRRLFGSFYLYKL
jgi:predicted RNA-binding Zn-ribbon protein involved in translation (DUF1610 family)